MNLSLLDPFQNDFPEVIEEYLDDRPCRSLAFNRRGTMLAAGCFDGSCVIWDFETRGVAKVLHDPASCSAPITSVAWSKCGYKLLAAACTQSRVVLWDVVSGRVEQALDFPTRVVSACLNPRDHAVCLVSPLGSPPLALDARQPHVRVPLPVAVPGEKLAPAAKEKHPPRKGKGGGGAGKGSAASEAGLLTSSLLAPAVFHRNGELAVVGSSSGSILLVRCCQASHGETLGLPRGARAQVLSSPAVICSFHVTGGPCIRQLALSRDCSFLLANCSDRVVRVFDLKVRPHLRASQGEAPDAGLLDGCEGKGDNVNAADSTSRVEVAGGRNGQPQHKAPSAGSSGSEGREAAESGREAPGGCQQHEAEKGHCGKQDEAEASLEHKPQSPQRNGGERGGDGDEEQVAGYEARLVLSKELQDAVNRVHWRSACFSGDGEFVMAGAASRGEHRIHIWSREFGQLVRILEGPSQRESASVLEVLWHPIQKIAVSVAASGIVYIWAQDYRESWSAFAPDFKELEENEEYVEREDEFDVNPPEQAEGLSGAAATAAPDDCAEIEVDVEKLERVNVYSDSDDSEGGLLFLPVRPEPDAVELDKAGVSPEGKALDVSAERAAPGSGDKEELNGGGVAGRQGDGQGDDMQGEAKTPDNVAGGEDSRMPKKRRMPGKDVELEKPREVDCAVAENKQAQSGEDKHHADKHHETAEKRPSSMPGGSPQQDGSFVDFETPPG